MVSPGMAATDAAVEALVSSFILLALATSPSSSPHSSPNGQEAAQQLQQLQQLQQVQQVAAARPEGWQALRNKPINVGGGGTGARRTAWQSQEEAVGGGVANGRRGASTTETNTCRGEGALGGLGVALAGRRWGGVMGAKEAIVDRGMPPAEYIAARLRGVEAVRP
jgi:hypothetical protein